MGERERERQISTIVCVVAPMVPALMEPHDHKAVSVHIHCIGCYAFELKSKSPKPASKGRTITCLMVEGSLKIELERFFDEKQAPVCHLGIRVRILKNIRRIKVLSTLTP